MDRSVPTPAASLEVPIAKSGFVGDYAAEVLRTLGVPTVRVLASQSSRRERHPQLEWARSGAMALCGLPGGPPLLAPAPLASAAQGAIVALRALAGVGWRGGELDGASLLGEHAAVLGLERRGSISPGGSCHMLEATDGWLAVNLARASDREMLSAWLEAEISGDVWSHLALRVAGQSTSSLLSRARLIGLPVAPVACAELRSSETDPWLRVTPGDGKPKRRTKRNPLVIDLSSLWAGPLCAHLLGLTGARVIKLESIERPDGARGGPSEFFDLLNAGKASVALEFTSARGRVLLERLLARADIVIESARPRALAQLGIVAEEWVTRRPGLTWLSITGYGRTHPEADWVAFGDDAGAAAGLSWATSQFNQEFQHGPLSPLFCGDAIADPLAGLHAAPAALASWSSGESRLLDISLAGVVRHILHQRHAPFWSGSSHAERDALVEMDDTHGWRVRTEDESHAINPPRARPVTVRSAVLGCDTERVLASLGIES